MALMAVRMLIQDHPAADRLKRRIKAHHKAVALPRRQILTQAQLRIAALAGTKRIAVQQHRPHKARGRAVVEVQARPALDHSPGIAQILQSYVEHSRRAQRIRRTQHNAAADVFFSDARQIDRHALPGTGCLHIAPMHL